MAEVTNTPTGDAPVPARPPARTRAEREGAPRDPFQEASGRVVDWVIAWRIPLALTVVGIFAAAGGVTVWRNYQAGLNEEASAEIARISSELPDDSALAQLGINLDDVARSPEETKERNDKYVAAATKLQRVAQDYPNVTSGRIAQLERAALLARAEKYDDAAAAYKSALDGGLEEPILRFRATSGLANVLRSQSKYPEAAQQYEKASKELDGLWRQLAIVELARTYELQGDYAAATKTYEAYLKEFPTASNITDVESRLAVAKAGGPPPAPAAPVAPSLEEAAPVTAPSAGEAPVAVPPDAAVPAGQTAPAAAPAGETAPAAAPAAPAGGGGQ